MNKRPIGVFDSGIGGISVLNELIKLLPAEDYIFYADTCHNPYGDKSVDKLKSIVDHIMDYFCKKNVKMVVIACNTATTQLISYLRDKYPDILFVGVEPAVKMAYDHYLDKNTLILATPATIKSERMKYLTDTYKQEHRILLSCPGLASIIENQQLNKLSGYFNSLFSGIDLASIEVIVLGCTHYSLIKKEIEEIFSQKIILLDGCNGVASRVKFLLNKYHLANDIFHKGNLSFFFTDSKTQKIVFHYIKNTF